MEVLDYVAKYFIIVVLHTLATFGGAIWYRRDTDFDDVIGESGLTTISTARSLADCGHACFMSHSCQSFFYVDGNGTLCQLISNILITQTSDTKTTPGAMYFVSGIECPPDDTLFRTVILADNSKFTYRVMRHMVNDSQAVDGCINEGAVLAKVITWAKFDGIRTLLDCEGYDQVHMYRIDGHKLNSGEGQSDWTTRDGDIIPQNFWAFNGTGCALMALGVDWYIIPSPCSHETFYICERI